MPQSHNPIVDPFRVAALRNTELLGTPPEAEFDRITRLTARLLAVPVALVSLVDCDHQYFKSCFGLAEPWASKQQTPLTHSFCQHVVVSRQTLVVNDARIDPILRDNLAIADLGVVAYLGSPLRLKDGHVIGALCAIDSSPRDWTEEQRTILEDLAAFVSTEIESRIAARSAEISKQIALETAQKIQLDVKFRILADVIPQIVWTSKPDGYVDYYNQRWFDYTGKTLEQTQDHGWADVVHPDDLQACFETSARTFQSGLPSEMEVRLRRGKDDEFRWHLSRSVPVKDEAGNIVQWFGTSTDIHDAKILRSALEASRDELEQRVAERTAELEQEHCFLEAVLDSIADGIVACDASGRLRLFNRATRELHGASEQDLPPEAWAKHYSLFRQDGVTPLQTHEVPLYRAFNDELVKDEEFVINAPAGRGKRRLEATGCAIYDHSHRKIGAVVAMHDVTESAAAEEKFSLMFNGSSVPHFLLQDGKILDCNAAAVDILGCRNKAELLSRHPADFSPEFQPDGRRSGETRREIDQNVIKTGFQRFEWTLQKADGTQVFVEVSLTPVKLDGKDAIISVCHDLTQRVAGERALATSKRFAENIADHSSCSIYIRDLNDETFIYRNRETLDFMGRDVEQKLGVGQAFNLAFFHPADLAKVGEARQAIKTAIDGQVVEYQARCRNAKGEWRSVLHRQSVFQRDLQGHPCQVMGTAQDISDLLQAQTDLTAAKEAAEAATRAKSEFLANMSHEIRTPMTAILGYSRMLEKPGQTEQQRIAHVQIVRRNGEHLLQILNDILDISKVEAGQMTVEQVDCDFVSIVNGIEQLLRPRADEKNLTFALEYLDQIPRAVKTDATRVRQILLNLVGNAIKFTEKGSVRISVSVKGAVSEPVIKIDISDTGIGLTPDQEAVLFRPFVQADTSMTRRFGGTGLGLAICKRMTDLLHGQLTAQSTYGRGSVFTLTLPVAVSKDGIGDSDLTARGIVGSDLRFTGRVLVVEDSLDNSRLVKAVLEDAGLTAVTVLNGQIAIDSVVAAAATDRPFDLVLMDMQMPVLDGYHATAHLRAAGFRQLPIIAFTAHASAEEQQRCINAGCDECVTKPIDFDALITTVRKHIPAPTIDLNENLLPGLRDLHSGATDVRLHSDKSEHRLIKQFLQEYIAGLPEHVAELQRSLASNDLALLRLKVHQLRGSGGSYGFPDISRCASEAENEIAALAELEQIRTSVEALIAMVRRVEGYGCQLEQNIIAKRDQLQPVSDVVLHD